MTTAVLNQKVESLRNCIERIESKKPFTADDLRNSFDLQDIISINLERAVQISVDIASHLLAEGSGPTPTTMADSFAYLHQSNIISEKTAQSLIKATGLRNLLVHEYSKIDWAIVATVANSHLDTFRNFVLEISKT